MTSIWRHISRRRPFQIKKCLYCVSITFSIKIGYRISIKVDIDWLKISNYWFLWSKRVENGHLTSLWRHISRWRNFQITKIQITFPLVIVWNYYQNWHWQADKSQISDFSSIWVKYGNCWRHCDLISPDDVICRFKKWLKCVSTNFFPVVEY